MLIHATRGSGRTTLLRALARELSAQDDLAVVVVLIDERPEEAPAWREALPDAELAIATADMRPKDQLRVVELAVSQAKRRVEKGEDVAILIDSLSRLAVAADDPAAAKPIFAAGRETAAEESGSLTVIATVLTDTDDAVASVLSTTENVTVVLDGSLAREGVYPAIDARPPGSPARTGFATTRSCAPPASSARSSSVSTPARQPSASQAAAEPSAQQLRPTRSSRSALTRSRPRPQAIVSLPPPPASSRSAPLPPRRRSPPAPPLSRSLPAPPRKSSAPVPPARRSSPPAP